MLRGKEREKEKKRNKLFLPTDFNFYIVKESE